MFGIKFWLVKVWLEWISVRWQRSSIPPNQPLTGYVVLRLLEPYMENKNVMTANLFTLVNLASKL